jgi:hypothetical protein
MVANPFHQLEQPAGTTAAGAAPQDLFLQAHGKSPIIPANDTQGFDPRNIVKVGGPGQVLEPGSGPPATEPPPRMPEPQPTSSTTINDRTNVSQRTTVDNTNNIRATGGKANATATAETGPITQNAGSTKLFAPAIGLSSFGGGGLCPPAGFSIGALGTGVGFQIPDHACERAQVGAQNRGTDLNFSVEAARTALDGMNQALTQVDRAAASHTRGNDGVAGAHLEGANFQRGVAERMAVQSTVAAEGVLGKTPPITALSGGAWGADILNANSPAPEAAPPRPYHPRPAAPKQTAAKSTPDCPCDKKPEKP